MSVILIKHTAQSKNRGGHFVSFREIEDNEVLPSDNSINYFSLL